MEPLRLGILGAARITDLAIIKPVEDHRHPTGRRGCPGPRSAPPRLPKLHGIGRVHESYLDVINDPEVEAVYNPLANSLHARWNKAAIAAGKHVFTEKPSASNATEAEEVAAQVERHRSTVLRGLPLPLAPADREAARHSRQRRAR